MSFYLYKYIVNPLMLVAAQIISMFNKRIRQGLKNRSRVLQEVAQWVKVNDQGRHCVIFHTASLGEFEHIKLLISEIKQTYNTENVVTFFSTSGYAHAQLQPGMDFKTYVPIESFSQWKKFYDLLSPALLIIAKHDVWPAQIWMAKEAQIPVYLINASLSESSSRTGNIVKRFLSSVYRNIDRIYTISEDDAECFKSTYKIDNVEHLGDTKYDQVVYRKHQAQKSKPLPEIWLKDHHCIVCGSIWPEDAKHLFPALLNTVLTNKKWKLILVPHEPTETFIANIKKYFSVHGVSKFSARKELREEQTLVVDEIGHLAELYNYAHIAYVGGSFKQGIHNTMEPAIFGVPVIYGPVHRNSYEAIQLAKGNGGIVVQDQYELEMNLKELMMDETRRADLGTKALKYAQNKTGATKVLLQKWSPILGKSK
jgi:3-deoxy-D-manno-octulosonic-acid transferase